MANIVEVGGDRRLQLGAEEFARTFNFGGKWSWIRIGLRWGPNGTSSFLGGLKVGVCVGDQLTYTSASTTYGAWLWWPRSDTGYAYNAGGGTPYFARNDQYTNYGYKTGATPTWTHASYSGASGNILAASNTSMSCCYIDFTRGPSYGNQLYVSYSILVLAATAQLWASLPEYQHQWNMEVGNYLITGVYPTVNGYMGSSYTLTVPNYSTQWPDTLSVVWSNSTPAADFSSINVIRYW